MSDISASDAGSVSDAGAADADFDLDAAVEEFAANAPEDWKGKAGKIQSELKGLRGKYTPYRDAFDGIADSDRDAVFSLLNGLKSGNTEGVTQWMLQAAKGLAGDKFGEYVASLTPAEQRELAEDLADNDAGEKELTVAEQIQKALDERDQAHAKEQESARRISEINAKFQELGLNIERDANGRLVDFTAQQVAQMAINHGGDIDKGFEAYNKWMGDQAKAFLQKHQGDPTLSPQGTPVTSPDPGSENLSPKEKALARIQRVLGGPEA